jgi:hypothetical protein
MTIQWGHVSMYKNRATGLADFKIFLTSSGLFSSFMFVNENGFYNELAGYK